MADVGYLDNTLVHVHSIKEMDNKKAVVGQNGQALCDLGKLSKNQWREWPQLASEHWHRPALEYGARKEEQLHIY